MFPVALFRRHPYPHERFLSHTHALFCHSQLTHLVLWQIKPLKPPGKAGDCKSFIPSSNLERSFGVVEITELELVWSSGITAETTTCSPPVKSRILVIDLNY